MLANAKFAIVAALVATANALTVATPASLITCQPAQLVFSGGSGAPYFVAIIPGGQVSAASLEDLPQSQSSPVTWKVDLAAGTNVTIKITDNGGTIAYSSPVIIQAGSDTSCVGSGGASASASASKSASGSATGSMSGSASATSRAASAASSGAAIFTRDLTGGLVALTGLVATAFGVVM